MDTVNIGTTQQLGIGKRKEKHLSICTDPQRFSVEGTGAGFEAVHLIHDSLPEISAKEIDTSVEFLGHSVSLPFFIHSVIGKLMK